MQHFGTPITDETKDAREALRLALGLGESVPFAEYINHIPSQYDPLEVFGAGQQGFFYEPNDIYTLFQDAAGLVPVTSHNNPIGRVKDKSGNGFDAVQSISARRMLYKESPPRLFLDKVDDELVINIPTGGWVGTMVIATELGTASYEVNLPAGDYLIGGRYFAGSAIIGVLFRHGSLTDSEKVAVEKYFVSKGAVESFINIDNFYQMWRSFSIVTNFPLINTSSATSLYFTWSYCSSLTTFPLLNTASIINFGYAWIGCTSLTNFPANFFDNIKGGNLTNAFANTNLNQASIDGILTSLVTSGIATGTRKFDQSGGSAPSATGEAAIDTLRSRGWTVNVTGGY